MSSFNFALQEEHNIQIRGEQPPKKEQKIDDQSNKSGILAGKWSP